MSSFMLQRFAAYGILCRLGGCFFIQNFRKHSLEKATATWKTPYTLYSASCLAVIFTFQVTFMMKRVDIINDISRNFSHSLILLLQATVTLKSVINFASMVAGSAQLLRFFRKSAEFEKSSGFRSSKRSGRQSSRRHGSFLRRFCVITALINSYVVMMYFFVGALADDLSPQWIVAGKILGSLGGAFFYLYDSLPYVVLRGSSAVLVQYIRAQSRAFERCSRSSVFRRESRAPLELETIRRNLGVIKELKDSLNAAWQCPLAALSAGIIFVVCVAFYSIFHDSFYKRQVWISLSYCVYSSLSFMEMAYVSQALSDEALQLKDSTKMMPTSHATDDYVQQLRYLHDTIEPKGMCLSCGGFFRLNKSLLVSMAGAMITYTVILVQTSDNLSHKIDASNSTTMA